MNGPGGGTDNLKDIFFVARDEVVNAPPQRFQTQAAVPTTVMPKDSAMAEEKCDLDEDLTTCQDAVKGLKADYKSQKVSMEQFFKNFDENGSGWISRKEFDVGLRKLGYELSELEVRHMIRCFGVNEWDEGLTMDQFGDLITDDICDDYGNVRGNVNDGRSAVMMGNTSTFPKGIQPDNGDTVLASDGSKSYMKLDPMMRTFGKEGEERKKLYGPSPMGNTTHDPRRTLPDFSQKAEGDPVVRKCIAVIQDKIEQSGVKGAFVWLDGNSNRFLTPDDLVSTLHKERINEKDAAKLCNFMDFNGDGHVSYKDFMTTMSEAAKQIPDNNPRNGRMTDTLR